MRPTDDDYDRYVYLLNIFRENDYDESRIREKCPFLIQDPLFNAILCRANESLVQIAEILGESPERVQSWNAKTATAIQSKLWHGTHTVFDAYDLVAEDLIEIDTAAGFMPLFAGAATAEQAEKLYLHLNSCSFCALHQGNCFTIPNYDTQKAGFERTNYWRDPIWININWMLAQGLHQYGYTLKADSLQKDLVQLPIRFGFHEYFDSFEGTGYGSDKFSWTAALFIDLVQEFYAHDETPSRIVRYIKSFVPEETVLNNGSKLPEVETDTISQALMHSIRTLRDLYYDTKRELVDYKRLKGSAEFQQYRVLTNGLKHFDLSLLTGRKEKMAFWINLYNTIVVDAIVSLGVKKSVREIPEFFRSVKYAIGPYVFSADDIEHGVLRVNVEPWFYPFKLFGRRDPRRKYTVQPIDPRIHFALVCGSRSCAPIDFYETDHIYDQLEEAARSFINSSEVIVLPEKGKLYVSEIFRWYEHDFGGIQGIVDFLYDYLSGDEARNFLRQHRTELEIDYLQYDWNLNR